MQPGRSASGARAMGQGEQGAGSWVVHRQDDYGNRFVVRAGLDREEAGRLVAELEARGHKQVYWTEPERPERPRARKPTSDTPSRRTRPAFPTTNIMTFYLGTASRSRGARRGSLRGEGSPCLGARAG